ncbi:MAG: ATPase, T2SS/T4P/T4SS family, partial [Candidatus Paceibacterota bacterium]
MDLLTHLQNQGLISPEIHQSIAEGAAAGNIDIESSLIEAGVDKAQLRTQIAAYYQIPEFTPENDTNIQQSVLEHLPYDSAQHYHIIPLKVEDNVLYVGVNDPEDLRIKEVLSFVSSKYDIPYKFVFLLNEDLDKLLKQYENLSGEVDEALNSLESELNQDISDKNNAEKEETKLTNEHIKEDAPVTRIVATVLRYAIDGGASDIHIEPNDKKVGVRFRVDGILVKSLELPLKVQSAVVARIKILSSLRLDEKRKPQDGRFSA